MPFEAWVARDRRVGALPGRRRGTLSFFEHTPTLNRALQILRRERFLLIEGAEGRGKSTVAKQIGWMLGPQRVRLPLFRGRGRIVVLDCKSPSPDTIQNIVNSIEGWDPIRPLWIVEDCQHAEDELRQILSAVKRTRRAWFIFCWRRGDSDESGEDVLDELVEEDARILLTPEKEWMRGIIQLHLNRYGQRTGQSPPGISDADVVWAMDASGGNLRALQSYLDAWRPHEESLRSLTPDRISQFIVQTRLRPLRDEGSELIRAYIGISALYQFDVPAAVEAFPIQACARLEAHGLMTFSGGTYRLPHPSEARQNVEAFALMGGTSPAIVTQDVLTDYLRRDPRNRDWVIRAVISDPMYDFRSAFISSLAPEVIPAGGVRLVGLYIRNFGGDANVFQALWEAVGGTKKLLDVIRSSNITSFGTLTGALRKVGRHDLAAELDEGLTFEDKVKLNARASMRTVAVRLRHYVNQGSPGSLHFAREILREVLSRDFDKRVKRSSVAAYGRLIEVAPEVDIDLATMAATGIADHGVFAGTGTSEQLGLLLNNLRFASATQEKAAARIVAESEPSYLFASAAPLGYAHLLGHLRRVVPSLCAAGGRRFFEVFVRRADAATTSQVPTRDIRATIWNLLLIGVDPTPWLERAEVELVRRFSESAPSEAFVLGWNILQANRRVFVSVFRKALAGIEQRVRKSTSLQMEELALLGLLEYAGCRLALAHVPHLNLPQLQRQLASLKEPSTILFALRGLKGLDLSTYTTLVAGWLEEGTTLEEKVAPLIGSNPLARSRILLDRIARDRHPGAWRLVLDRLLHTDTS